MFKDKISTIAFSLMMGFSLLGIAYLVVAFNWITNKNKELKAENTEQPTVQSLITMECTSISGVTMVFSLREFPNPLRNPSYYAAIDNNGVVVIINSENYGQWKCKE